MVGSSSFQALTWLPGKYPHAAERRSVGWFDIDTQSIFSLLSELAIGLAGFGGVAAAFGGRDRSYGPVERDRMRALFTHAFLALFICLFTIALFAFEMDAQRVLDRSTLLGALVQAPATVAFCRLGVRNFRDPGTTTGWFAFVATTGGTISILLAFCMGVVMGGSLGWLVTGVSGQLLFGLWVFTRMLLHRN